MQVLLTNKQILTDFQWLDLVENFYIFILHANSTSSLLGLESGRSLPIPIYKPHNLVQQNRLTEENIPNPYPLPSSRCIFQHYSSPSSSPSSQPANPNPPPSPSPPPSPPSKSNKPSPSGPSPSTPKTTPSSPKSSPPPPSSAPRPPPEIISAYHPSPPS